MKGLLQRLARRAAGQPAAIRSVVSLPYAAAPALQLPETTLSFSEDPGEPSLPEQRLQSKPSDTAAPVMRAPRRAVDAENLLPEAQGPVAANNPPDPAARQQNPSISEHMGERPEADFSSVEASPPVRLDVPELVTSEPTPSTTHVVITPPRTFARPLLPLRPTEQFLDPPTGVRDRLQTSQTVEDSIEVQISIGRIDVTAVQSAAQLKKTVAPTEKPMSLNDYLARRGGV
jgi:hypothetical protein